MQLRNEEKKNVVARLQKSFTNDSARENLITPFCSTPNQISSGCKFKFSSSMQDFEKANRQSNFSKKTSNCNRQTRNSNKLASNPIELGSNSNRQAYDLKKLTNKFNSEAFSSNKEAFYSNRKFKKEKGFDHARKLNEAEISQTHENSVINGPLMNDFGSHFELLIDLTFKQNKEVKFRS